MFGIDTSKADLLCQAVRPFSERFWAFLLTMRAQGLDDVWILELLEGFYDLVSPSTYSVITTYDEARRLDHLEQVLKHGLCLYISVVDVDSVDVLKVKAYVDSHC